MKYLKLLPVMMVLAMLTACLTEGEVEEAEVYKTPYAERMKMLEQEFLAAEKEGKIITGVIVEGNSLFNGTTEPQNKPYGTALHQGRISGCRYQRGAEQQAVYPQQG